MKRTLRKAAVVFIVAFLLNFIWEHLHHVLYVHYKGGEITDLILLRAALFDGSITAVFALPFLHFKRLQGMLWIFAFIALAFAIGLELWALEMGRWAYKDAMPVLPIVGSGLTPTIQLALLGYVSVKVALMKEERII